MRSWNNFARITVTPMADASLITLVVSQRRVLPGQPHVRDQFKSLSDEGRLKNQTGQWHDGSLSAVGRAGERLRRGHGKDQPSPMGIENGTRNRVVREEEWRKERQERKGDRREKVTREER